MARPHPHKRAARLAAISILSVLGAMAAVWTAPRMSAAVDTWMSTPPVQVRTASLSAPLPVGPAAPATGDASADATTTPGTLQAGSRRVG
jgi:hypothetical protein